MKGMEENGSVAVDPPDDRCTMCGHKIHDDSKNVQIPGQFLSSSRININGVECKFDSEFCATLFRKLQVIYGDGFCSDLARP